MGATTTGDGLLEVIGLYWLFVRRRGSQDIGGYLGLALAPDLVRTSDGFYRTALPRLLGSIRVHATIVPYAYRK